MKKYLFKTATTMKEYNNTKYWISNDIIDELVISAENLRAALKVFQEKAEDCGISISNNSIKNKGPMYRTDQNGEDRQVGYVLTGKTEIWDQYNNIRGSVQYVDVWTEIQELVSVF